MKDSQITVKSLDDLQRFTPLQWPLYSLPKPHDPAGGSEGLQRVADELQAALAAVDSKEEDRGAIQKDAALWTLASEGGAKCLQHVTDGDNLLVELGGMSWGVPECAAVLVDFLGEVEGRAHHANQRYRVSH